MRGDAERQTNMLGMTTPFGPTVMISSGPTSVGRDQPACAPPLADVVTRSR